MRMNEIGKVVQRVMVRCIISASIFSVSWAVANIAYPPYELDGLSVERITIELFGETMEEKLTWFVRHWVIGALVFLVSAGWLKRLSLFGAVLFGLASGAYVYALAPPVDLIGTVMEWSDRASQDEFWRNLLGLLSIFSLIAALLIVGIAIRSVFYDERGPVAPN